MTAQTSTEQRVAYGYFHIISSTLLDYANPNYMVVVITRMAPHRVYISRDNSSICEERAARGPVRN